MKPFLTAAALVVAVATVGCSTSANLDQVRVGMTRDQIVSLLGKPDSTGAQGNVEYLTYYLVSASGYGRDQPYFVRLVDGRVESFGRFAQMYDLESRPTAGMAGTSNAYGSAPMGAATAPAAATPPPNDVASQLERLKQLHDQGVLTDAEFERAKAKVLGEAPQTP